MAKVLGADAAKVVAFLGFLVIVLGYVHAHWPGSLKTVGLDDNATLGWTDAKAFGTGGSNYMNVGSVILVALGGLLMVLARKAPHPVIYFMVGALFLVTALTIYLWQTPWG